jgi:hypothetical protein
MRKKEQQRSQGIQLKRKMEKLLRNHAKLQILRDKLTCWMCLVRLRMRSRPAR